MNPDVYSGAWGGSHCRDSPVPCRGRNCDCEGETCVASEKYFEEFKKTFKYSLPGTGAIAAFIAESIQVSPHDASAM